MTEKKPFHGFRCSGLNEGWKPKTCGCCGQCRDCNLLPPGVFQELNWALLGVHGCAILSAMGHVG